MVEKGSSSLKEMAQVIPPVSVTVTSIAGIPIQQWVYLLTALYTAIQIARLFPKLYGCALCFKREGWTCRRTCKD